MNTTTILNKLINRKDLTAEETESFLFGTINGNIGSAKIGAILTALRIKGETTEEIYGFIKAMRKNMTKIALEGAIDVCGTGGDGSGTFNVSTGVALVVSGAGVKVAKHGNRSASSICGSADVLEKLGVNINLKPSEAEKVFKKTGVIFLFAPLFHSALKNVGIVRKELGIRTIFNYLGPFSNPAQVKRQLVGVSNVKIAEKMAQVAKKLEYEKLIIVASHDGLDEISLGDKTIAYEISGGKIKKYMIDSQKLGFKKVNKQQLIGGDASINSKIILDILSGKRCPMRDIVIINSAFALYVAGVVKNIKEGIKLAELSIDSGKAKLVLKNLIKETQKYE